MDLSQLSAPLLLLLGLAVFGITGLLFRWLWFTFYGYGRTWLASIWYGAAILALLVVEFRLWPTPGRIEDVVAHAGFLVVWIALLLAIALPTSSDRTPVTPAITQDIDGMEVELTSNRVWYVGIAMTVAAMVGLQFMVPILVAADLWLSKRFPRVTVRIGSRAVTVLHRGTRQHIALAGLSVRESQSPLGEPRIVLENDGQVVHIPVGGERLGHVTWLREELMDRAAGACAAADSEPVPVPEALRYIASRAAEQP